MENPYPGGQILFRWKNWGPDNLTAEDGSRVLEAVPAQRFVFQWRPDSPGDATIVEINFQATKNGTIVSLREHRFADAPSERTAMMHCATG